MIQIGAAVVKIDSPIEHLMACHRRIEERLNTLVAATLYFGNGDPSAFVAVERSLHFLETSGVRHTEDEEQSIFPRLRNRVLASDGQTLESLNADHNESERMLAELKNLVRGAGRENAVTPGWILRYSESTSRLQRFYLVHIRKEDEILMDMIRRSLTDEELEEVAEEMRTRRA